MANAAEAKFKKKEIEVSGGQQTQLTKPKEPPKESDKKQTGPTLTVEAFVGQQRDKIAKITDKQIKYMQDLLRTASDDDPQKPDYYFRLGELYSERQRDLGFQARGLDQKIFEAQQAKNTGLAAQLKNKQKAYEKAAGEARPSRRSRATSPPRSTPSTTAWTRCSSASPTCCR